MCNTLSAADRGVSTTLGYVLTLTITAVLISGLLIAGGTLVENQRDRIAQQELAVAGEQLAVGLSGGERLGEGMNGGVMQVNIWLPERVAGGAYTLEIRNHPTPSGQPARATIVATAQVADAQATVSLRTTIPVANRTVIGGPVVISHRNVTGDSRRELVVNGSRELEVRAPAVISGEDFVYVDDSVGAP